MSNPLNNLIIFESKEEAIFVFRSHKEKNRKKKKSARKQGRKYYKRDIRQGFEKKNFKRRKFESIPHFNNNN